MQFKHTILGLQKRFCRHFWCRGTCVQCAYQGHAAFCISNTTILSIQRNFCWHFWWRGIRNRRTTLQSHFWGIVHLKHTHTLYPKNTYVGTFGAEVRAFSMHTGNRKFLALCISNTPTLSIQRYVCWLFWCRGMRVWRATLHDGTLSGAKEVYLCLYLSRRSKQWSLEKSSNCSTACGHLSATAVTNSSRKG